MEEQATNEPKYRLNIKQTAKQDMYWDISYKCNDFDELAVEIDKLKRLAIKMTNQETDGTGDNDE